MKTNLTEDSDKSQRYEKKNHISVVPPTERAICVRIRQFIVFNDIRESHFAKAIEMSQGSVNNVTSEQNAPSLRMITSMARMYRVSMEWLIRGEGEMFTDATYLAEEPQSPYRTAQQPAMKDREIIEMQQDMIAMLKEQLANEKTKSAHYKQRLSEKAPD
jgi:transcriptional regulator with XRE-family HTH domain